MNFKLSLENTIRGFHIIHSNPIIERNWEEIFIQANKKIYKNIKYDSGSHKSGMDCIINNISYSNKTAKIKNKKLSISSYRLTKCNNITDIINEIDNVRKNFNYYALLARKESNNIITYNYYKIPSNFFIANNFIWNNKYSKTNKLSGWKTNIINGIYLDITCSMSNQLWIHLEIDYIGKYLVNSINVNKCYETINYSDIYKKRRLFGCK